ncbi:MAG TPA: restriction endonuclease subunit S, partial [Anaerolineales bacterium]|nr:restriction endonuclease subunit S [Anaerolineales bacterium]
PMKRIELNEREKERALLRKGDLLFARRSLVAEGAGKCSIVKEVNEPTTFESSIIRARPDPTKTSSDYLFYYFNSAVGRRTLGTILRQVAVSGITSSDLVSLRLSVPPLRIQKRVANFFSALDDKIELNNKMNITLEQIAQALFKSWFIDFDPVKAKAASLRSERIYGSEISIFPAEFDESNLGLKPKGWTVCTIGELVKAVGGGTPDTKQPRYWKQGKHHWATPKDLSTLMSPVLLSTERTISDEGLRRISSGLLPSGSVLMSSRAPIGYLAISEIPVAINQGFIGMLPEEGISNLFILLWAKANQQVILGRANGSTFLEISKSNFRPIQLICPTSTVMKAFDERVRPLYQRIANNERETESLIDIRDSLLPKLISGQIQIPSEHYN